MELEQDPSVKLTELEQRIRGNTRRIEGLERGQETLNRLTTAVEVLATRQESMSDTLERLNDKVSALEARPARRWDALTDKALCAVAGAVLAWIMSGAGL